MTAFHQDLINLRSQIWLQIPAETQCETTDAGQLPNEIQVSANGNGLLVEHKYQDRGVYVLSSDDHFLLNICSCCGNTFAPRLVEFYLMMR